MNKTLIVIIFIGIVLVWKFILFPEKLDFTDRAKVLQGLSLATKHKAAVNNYWKQNKALPTREDWQRKGDKISVDLSKSLVESIEISEESPGSITVTYTTRRDPEVAVEISGKKIVLKPTVRGELLDWTCKGNVPVEFLPKPCR